MSQQNSVIYMRSLVKLAKDRDIFLAEDVSQHTAEVISAMLIYYDSQNQEEDINLYIKTSGGDVSALFHIYDIMNMISAPIKTINIGKCYSAGSVIFAAGSPGKRYSLPNSEVMMHGIQMSFPIQHKDILDNQEYLKFTKSQNLKLHNILAKHTGQPVEKIIEDSKRDLYLNAAEALEYGFIDQIL